MYVPYSSNAQAERYNGYETKMLYIIYSCFEDGIYDKKAILDEIMDAVYMPASGDIAKIQYSNTRIVKGIARLISLGMICDNGDEWTYGFVDTFLDYPDKNSLKYLSELEFSVYTYLLCGKDSAVKITDYNVTQAIGRPYPKDINNKESYLWRSCDRTNAAMRRLANKGLVKFGSDVEETDYYGIDYVYRILKEI